MSYIKEIFINILVLSYVGGELNMVIVLPDENRLENGNECAKFTFSQVTGSEWYYRDEMLKFVFINVS
jgi:hypothetical protein